MAAIRVALAHGQTGGRGAAHHQLLLARPIEVAGGGGRKDAVSTEKWPSLQHRSVRCVEGVGLLVQRAGENIGAALQVGDGERCLHPVGGVRVRGGVAHRGKP